jgi:hypothetical protein
MEKSKFVAGKGPSFADRRNVVQAAKNISISSLWSQGLFAIQHWLRGEDVKQMPGNWSVIDRLAEGAEHAKVRQNLQLWLREKNIRRHPSRRCLREYRISQHLQQDAPPSRKKSTPSVWKSIQRIVYWSRMTRTRSEHGLCLSNV